MQSLQAGLLTCMFHEGGRVSHAFAKRILCETCRLMNRCTTTASGLSLNFERPVPFGQKRRLDLSNQESTGQPSNSVIQARG
jgi:hypothetical protein